jgi:hypothetical protein
MNKKVLLACVVVALALVSCVGKHQKCAAYDNTQNVEETR